MTTIRIEKMAALAAVALFLFAPWNPVRAIDFDEVRDFEEVFVLSADAPARDRIELRWAIEDGFYLYNNKFLQFRSATEGVVLGEPQIPPGKRGFDELLGEEVEKYHGELRVTLPLESVAPGIETLQLNVRSQGCMEDVLCYPPTAQRVEVRLPQGASASPLQAPGGAVNNPLLGDYEPPALSAEDAFRFESIGLDPGTALLRFTAQPGYYLYVDQFEFRVTGADGFVIAGADMPDGVIKDDPEFGPVPVYYGQVEIPLRFNRPAGPAQDITVEADFQGCRDGDICYPPMSRAVGFSMPAAPEPIGAMRDGSTKSSGPEAPPVSDQDRLARLLTSSPWRAVLAFFVAGLLLAFTPCVLPMVPILSGIIIGQGDRLTPPRAFWLSLVYVLAMAVTYTVAGVLAGLFGQNLQAAFQNPWIISGFVVIFILLALSMFGFYELQLPSRLQTRLTEASNRQRGGELWGVAVMGFLSALIVGPCVAPPLMAALIVIGSSGDAVLGGAALFALAMGMGLPLILFGVSAGKLVPRAGRWMDAVKAVFGVAMLGLSIWMLERILPGAVIMLLWGALAIGCAIYLGALDRIEPGASGWRRLWKSLGVMLLVLGVLEFIGAAAGGDDWQRPLAGLSAPLTGPGVAHSEAAFEAIKSVDDLDRTLAGAGQGAMLDFYADWCIECKRMERNTFPEPRVAALMDELTLMQADVTANDAVDQALMRRFGVIGPPAILFFDRAGREMEAYRLVGYFDPDTFAAHLQRVLDAR
jgi:thiol:disulfide interchange protein DsbD